MLATTTGSHKHRNTNRQSTEDNKMGYRGATQEIFLKKTLSNSLNSKQTKSVLSYLFVLLSNYSRTIIHFLFVYLLPLRSCSSMAV